MRGLSSAASRLAAAAQRRRVAELARSLRDLGPGLKVESAVDSVVLSGKGLVRRMLTDSAFRFIARVQR